MPLPINFIPKLLLCYENSIYQFGIGGFFYLIVGAHALHALAGLSVLSVAYVRLHQGRLKGDFLAATQVLWYFVVVLWPFLYVRVYL